MRYVFNELSFVERVRFHAHLAICRGCRAYLQNYRQTMLLGRAAFEEPQGPAEKVLPEDLVRAILAVAPLSPRPPLPDGN
jgi:hypothetical protein